MLAALVKHVMFAIFAALRAKLIFFLTRRRERREGNRPYSKASNKSLFENLVLDRLAATMDRSPHEHVQFTHVGAGS